jgi:hypothetical protein
MFEIATAPTVDPTTAANAAADHLNMKKANPSMADSGPRKIVLPRRLGEPRFGPQSYYYEASRTGVLPTGCSAH